jgi:hypothetical protein
MRCHAQEAQDPAPARPSTVQEAPAIKPDRSISHRAPASARPGRDRDRRAQGGGTRVLCIILALLLVLPALLISVHDQASAASPITIVHGKLKHIDFIIMENHSFDQIFGRFPGADGATTAHDSLLGTIPLLHAPPHDWHDLDHEFANAEATVDKGKMDAFRSVRDTSLWNTNVSDLGLPLQTIEQLHATSTMAQIATQRKVLPANVVHHLDWAINAIIQTAGYLHYLTHNQADTLLAMTDKQVAAFMNAKPGTPLSPTFGDPAAEGVPPHATPFRTSTVATG